MLRKTILAALSIAACTAILVADNPGHGGRGGDFHRPQLANGGPTDDEKAALNDAAVQSAVKAVQAVQDDIKTLQDLRKKMTSQGGMKAYMILCQQAGLMNGMPKPPRGGDAADDADGDHS